MRETEPSRLRSAYGGFPSLLRRITEQETRTFVLTVAGMWVSGVGVAFTAARFA